jgi:dihydroneopterin aldolase
MISKIELKDIRLYAFHGVLPQERKVGNFFTIDLSLEAPLDQSIRDDDLSGTINYATVYELVKEEMDIPSNLLEHVAGRILYALKKKFPQITAIQISLSKLHPPLGGSVHSASVILQETYTA